jgi:hypothetical protein
MDKVGDCLAEKNASMLSLDLTDPANVALAGYSRRIGTPLTETAVLANTDLAGSLDDFLGAVYALIQAKKHGFTDRTAPIDITAVEKRARMIAVGKVRLDGKWIAGGYFRPGPAHANTSRACDAKSASSDLP